MVTSTSPLLSFFNAKKTIRCYIIASIIASYGLVLYELFPQFLLETKSLVSYFVIPSSVVSALLYLLPRFLKAGNTSSEGEYVLNDVVFTNDPVGEPSSSTKIIQTSTIPETEFIPEQAIVPESIEIPSVVVPQIDNSAIQGMIEERIAPVGEEIYKIKGDTALLREDMSTIKISIGDMFTKFEDAMIDLKSLQAEITNPLNFVQKNSESSEFKEVLAIQSTNDIGHLAFVPESKLHDNKLGQRIPDGIISNQTTSKLDNFKEMFDDKITLGRMMSIVALVGEIMQKSGKNSINVLTDQCKIMGLSSDIEQTIHSIAKMLDNSTMSVNETLIQMYKFGQIVGIADKEANEHYIRLTTNTTKQEHRIPHEEYF